MVKVTTLKPNCLVDFIKIFSKEFLKKYESQINVITDKMYHIHLIYTDTKYNQCVEFCFSGNGAVKVWGLARGECFGYYTQEYKVDTPKKEMMESIKYIFGFEVELDI